MPASWHMEPIHEVREIDGGYQATTTICMTTLIPNDDDHLHDYIVSSTDWRSTVDTESSASGPDSRPYLTLLARFVTYLDIKNFAISMSVLGRCLKKEKWHLNFCFARDYGIKNATLRGAGSPILFPYSMEIRKEIK